MSGLYLYVTAALLLLTALFTIAVGLEWRKFSILVEERKSEDLPWHRAKTAIAGLGIVLVMLGTCLLWGFYLVLELS